MKTNCFALLLYPIDLLKVVCIVGKQNFVYQNYRKLNGLDSFRC